MFRVFGLFKKVINIVLTPYLKQIHHFQFSNLSMSPKPILHVMHCLKSLSVRFTLNLFELIPSANTRGIFVKIANRRQHDLH